MINFFDGQITDILPFNIAEKPEVKAISYALQKGTQLLYNYAQRLYLWTDIDNQPENILDLMAAELRTQYYRQDLDIGTKRRLVKGTLSWYITAGTPEAVEELIQAVFGEGEVKEWFEYDGKPYYFKVVTSAILTPDISDFFIKMIQRVKNTRSHLDAVEIRRTIKQPLYCCTANFPHYKPSAIIGGYNEKRTTHQKLFAGISPFSDYKPATITDGYAEQRISEQEFFTGTSQVLNYKPVAITDGYSIANIVEQKFLAGADQFLHYKPAAVTEGYQTTKIINQNLHMKAIAIAQYKPSAVIADAAN